MKNLSLIVLLIGMGLAGGCGQKKDDLQVPTSDDASRMQPPSTPSTGIPTKQTAAQAAKVVFETDGGDVTAFVEVVRRQRDVRRGLMYRTHLAEDAGMLFLFKREKMQSFWMKNTLISLDMIFVRATMVVAGVVANTPPRTKTSQKVSIPSQFVVEVNAGWAAKHGVHQGIKVRFEEVDDIPPPILFE